MTSLPQENRLREEVLIKSISMYMSNDDMDEQQIGKMTQ